MLPLKVTMNNKAPLPMSQAKEGLLKHLEMPLVVYNAMVVKHPGNLPYLTELTLPTEGDGLGLQMVDFGQEAFEEQLQQGLCTLRLERSEGEVKGRGNGTTCSVKKS